MKHWYFRIILSLFAVACFSSTLMIAQNAQVSNNTTEEKPKFVAYYFHGTSRCATCRKIEQLTSECINSSFASELKNGRLEFRPINMEEEQHRHFVSDFKLYTRSLVIVRYSGNRVERYKNLTRVWELVHSPQDFREYVRTEIGRFLESHS